MSFGEKQLQGAHNLLVRCIGASTGESLLLVEEPETYGRFDPAVADCIAKQALHLGLSVNRCRPDLISDPVDFPASVLSQMSDADHTVFLSRLGDYCRFTSLDATCSKTICYIDTLEALGSDFANLCHRLFNGLLERFEQELLSSKHWHIECPLGTDIQGEFNWPIGDQEAASDFTMNLFPVTTFIPVPCESAQGRVALSRWLVPGSAQKVEPGYLPLDSLVFAEVEDGIITHFSGDPETVRQVNAHYEHISSALGVNRHRVHSWHAGLNPFTSYSGNLSSLADWKRWESISFASPRYLHFHTCGDEPPCEIAWSLFNPSVRVDGERYWHNGQFLWYQRPDNRSLLDRHIGGSALLRESADIGVGV